MTNHEFSREKSYYKSHYSPELNLVRFRMPILEVSCHAREKMEKAVSEAYAKNKNLIAYDRCLKDRILVFIYDIQVLYTSVFSF